MKITKKEIALALTLITLGIASRLLNLSPNFELVTAVTLAAGYFLKQKGFIVPLVIMIITDMYIGNTIIFLFTWSGFLLSAIIGILLNQEKNTLKPATSNLKPILKSEAGAMLSVLVFFLWTNFGVVATTNMYQKSIEGLLQSYINGLPFLYNQIASNLIFAPMVFMLSMLILKWNVNVRELSLNKRRDV